MRESHMSQIYIRFRKSESSGRLCRERRIVAPAIDEAGEIAVPIRAHHRGQWFRRRISGNYYVRQPLKMTRSRAIAMIGALLLLVLGGIATYRQSTSQASQDRFHPTPGL